VTCVLVHKYRAYTVKENLCRCLLMVQQIVFCSIWYYKYTLHTNWCNPFYNHYQPFIYSSFLNQLVNMHPYMVLLWMIYQTQILTERRATRVEKLEKRKEAADWLDGVLTFGLTDSKRADQPNDLQNSLQVSTRKLPRASTIIQTDSCCEQASIITNAESKEPLQAIQ